MVGQNISVGEFILVREGAEYPRGTDYPVEWVGRQNILGGYIILGGGDRIS